jgi:hypothetical protein
VARIGIGPISTGPVTADSRGALWKALYVQDGSFPVISTRIPCLFTLYSTPYWSAWFPVYSIAGGEKSVHVCFELKEIHELVKSDSIVSVHYNLDRNHRKELDQTKPEYSEKIRQKNWQYSDAVVQLHIIKYFAYFLPSSRDHKIKFWMKWFILKITKCVFILLCCIGLLLCIVLYITKCIIFPNIRVHDFRWIIMTNEVGKSHPFSSEFIGHAMVVVHNWQENQRSLPAVEERRIGMAIAADKGFLRDQYVALYRH